MTPEELDRMERMWAEGASVEDIAMTLGYEQDTVYHNASYHRERFPYRRIRVTDEQRAEMVQMRKQGMSMGSIARLMGFTQTTVANNLRKATNDS